MTTTDSILVTIVLNCVIVANVHADVFV